MNVFSLKSTDALNSLPLMYMSIPWLLQKANKIYHVDLFLRTPHYMGDRHHQANWQQVSLSATKCKMIPNCI